MLKHKPTPFCFVFLIFPRNGKVIKYVRQAADSAAAAAALTRWNELMEIQ